MTTTRTASTAEAGTTRDGDATAAGHEVVSLDPATGDVVGRYPATGAEEVAQLTAAARSAAGPWWATGFEGRAAALRAWRRRIAEGGEELAALIHAENGKPLDDARVEVLAVLEHLEYAATNAARVLGRRDVPVPFIAANQEAWVEYLPYGVVAVIGPWNFPASTPMGIVAYALGAGNAVLLKPSEITPGVGVWLARSWAHAVPEQPDVLQAVPGFAATGQALVAAGMGKVAFTGSVRSGRAVARACAETLTPMLLELGGKDAVIVAEDADLDEAAAHIAWGALQNAGQGCISLERAYVVDAVHDAFVAKLAQAAARVRAGSETDSHIGPITLPTQIATIREHVSDALDRGATALVGGLDAIGDPFVTPTVLVDVPADALAATEETFGPTLAVIRVPDLDTAVALANDSPYGLGSAVFSRDQGIEIARRLRVGMTSINDALMTAQVPALPFGGRGDSGYGRKHGDEGLLEFAYPHAITAKTGPARLQTTTFDRPAGAMAGALAAVRDRILTDPTSR